MIGCYPVSKSKMTLFPKRRTQVKSVLRINSIAFGVCALSLLFSSFAFGFAKETKIQGSIPITKENKVEYTQLAKLSIQDAMAKSNKILPGKIVEIVLEEENGFLVYEAEIIGTDKSRKELVMDAGTGAVLQIKEKH